MGVISYLKELYKGAITYFRGEPGSSIEPRSSEEIDQFLCNAFMKMNERMERVVNALEGCVGEEPDKVAKALKTVKNALKKPLNLEGRVN